MSPKRLPAIRVADPATFLVAKGAPASPAKLLAEHADAQAWHADWRGLVGVVARAGGCDALIVDAPYSSRTHRGHDEGAACAKRAGDFSARIDPSTPDARHKRRYLAKSSGRRRIGYAFWTPTEVRAFVRAWEPLTRGWFVTLTDHVLARVWASALGRRGRYVFSPIACVEPGSRVRMGGDGPAQWSCWAVVARPRGLPWSKWGARPGAYVVPPGFGERAASLAGRVVGGKPLWLMERLVEDYSRPNALVVDPCMGGGTTLLAAQRTGRRAIGGDVDRLTAGKAADRIERPAQAPLFAMGAA